jgi:small subunit ribosomal protein S20
MAIMPVTVGALRKLRADKRKAATNLRVRKVLKEAVSTMRKKPTEKKLRELFSSVDRAVKVRVIHKNKAARLKSRLAALVKKK